ncbi:MULTISPECIES: hypothetical protein [unclassified Microcoleus]|uniref:hypothetical protein n=1 Tax=unclassified Microcoleus TaxID=2642155 RepID=UPI0025EFA83F|nr:MULTISPECIES: hypothetical protein [unclassified Microcoleus]
MSVAVLAASVAVVGMERAIASAFSIKDIASQIAQKTNVPILLPSEDIVEKYKFDSSETIYAFVSTASKYADYDVTFNNRPGDVGDAAFRFSISAQQGKDFERLPADSNPDYNPKYTQVKLFDSSQALVTTWCGGTACWSTVQWKSNGVLYRVTSKKRQPYAALAISNSAIKVGDRRLK